MWPFKRSEKSKADMPAGHPIPEDAEIEASEYIMARIVADVSMIRDSLIGIRVAMDAIAKSATKFSTDGFAIADARKEVTKPE